MVRDVQDRTCLPKNVCAVHKESCCMPIILLAFFFMILDGSFMLCTERLKYHEIEQKVKLDSMNEAYIKLFGSCPR